MRLAEHAQLAPLDIDVQQPKGTELRDAETGCRKMKQDQVHLDAGQPQRHLPGGGEQEVQLPLGDGFREPFGLNHLELEPGEHLVRQNLVLPVQKAMHCHHPPGNRAGLVLRVFNDSCQCRGDRLAVHDSAAGDRLEGPQIRPVGAASEVGQPSRIATVGQVRLNCGRQLEAFRHNHR